MKRLRDDGYANNPQFKRPFGASRGGGESYGQSQGPGGGGGSAIGGSGAGGSTQKLTTKDALTYLKDVKEIFSDEREKYDMFLDVMKNFKAQRIDTAGVIARVKELFKGHRHLILGFNTFLPKGFEITLTDEEEAPPKKTVEFEEAISFVNKIKTRFQNDDHVYKSFLDILNMYRKEHKGITEVYQEVASLFEDHADLLDEFTRFLPDNSATTSASHTALGRHGFHRYDERSSAVAAAIRQPHIEKRRRDKIVSPCTERDLSVERPDMDDDKTMIKLHKEQKKRGEKESRERRQSDQDYREPECETNGNVSMNRHADKRKAARKNEEVGGSANLASSEDKDLLRSMYSREFAFCDKVKDRLRSYEDYQAFLKCLHIYSTEIITRKELMSLVSDLLGKYPDLMEGFTEWLEHCERIDGFLSGVMSKKSLWHEGPPSRSLRADDKEQNRETDKEKERCKEKYWQKSIQELDLSNCRRCTPSYRHLPEDYPIPIASQRSELGAQVLNDHWVSVTSGSEDYSFKHMRRNQYEESLFRCEDDRFELDMLLESVSATATRAEELLNSINDHSIGADSIIRIEDHFSALNLRCIERLYGDHGLDVMDILRKNPSLALPVILTRIKQKQEEWTKCRQDFNKVWADIYAKNHYKSLDHRSFYFKQQDSKNLSTKSLVTEIKEIKERKEKEDDMLLAIAGGTRYPRSPDLEYEFAESEIHEDVYKLIKYSCEEVCSTKEQLNKVMRLWTSFLEPMLGVSPRPHNSDDSEDDDMSKQHSYQSTAISDRRSPSADNAAELSKPVLNEDGNTPAMHGTSGRTSFTDAEILPKEDGQTVAFSERLNNSDRAITTGVDITRGRFNMENSGHRMNSSLPNKATGLGHAIKSNVDDRSLSEVVASSLVVPTNGQSAEGSGVNGYKEATVDAAKNEKEEGELSPNGDSEEGNCVAYQDGTSQILCSPNNHHESTHNQSGGGEETCGQDRVGGNDADDDDTENVSEDGGDVSGSVSAADQCSREANEGDGVHDEVDDKAESEGEAEGTSEAHFAGGEFLPPCGRFPQSSRPLSKFVPLSLPDNEKKSSRVFYGNDTFYVLFRLHQALYERLLSAKHYCGSSELKLGSGKDNDSDPYARFISALYGLLDGSADNAKFEDDCRAIIGNQSYILFTLDKLVYKLVKQLQVISSDELDNKLLQMYGYERSRKPGTFSDSVYYENAHFVLHEENIYRFESSSSAPMFLSIQLVDEGDDKSEVVAVSIHPNFTAYLYNDYLAESHVKKVSSAVGMKRNMRRCTSSDESHDLDMPMENVIVVNGLECKMAAGSSKISYVLDTSDFFHRIGRTRSSTSSSGSSIQSQAKVENFRRFLEASVSAT